MEGVFATMRRFSKVIEDLELRDLPIFGRAFDLKWRVEQSIKVMA